MKDMYGWILYAEILILPIFLGLLLLLLEIPPIISTPAVVITVIIVVGLTIWKILKQEKKTKVK